MLTFDKFPVIKLDDMNNDHESHISVHITVMYKPAVICKYHFSCFCILLLSNYLSTSIIVVFANNEVCGNNVRLA